MATRGSCGMHGIAISVQSSSWSPLMPCCNRLETDAEATYCRPLCNLSRTCQRSRSRRETPARPQKQAYAHFIPRTPAGTPAQV
eukprot:scaffold1788_cov396-Prasinococcus_capsulatus_cf.AAC.9